MTPMAPVIETMVTNDFYVNNADPPAEFHGNPFDAVSPSCSIYSDADLVKC